MNLLTQFFKSQEDTKCIEDKKLSGSWLTLLLFWILAFLIAIPAHAQTKEQLEKQRLKLIKEIEQTSKFLQNTQKSKNSALNELKALESQISNRKKLISNIQSQITQANNDLKINNQKQDSLKKVSSILYAQYGKMLRLSYLQQLSNNKFTFLLSSENLNSFLLRWRYLNQFDAFTKQKEQEIKDLDLGLKSSSAMIEEALQKRKELLDSEQKNISKLEVDQKRKDELLKKLGKEEKNLQTELSKKQRERERLNAAIEKIILDALAKKKEKDKTDAKLPEADIRLAKDFSNNKSKLPWPIGAGRVTSKFGDQPHPTIKSLTISNNGIDISSTSDQMVSAIFDGVVVGVTTIPGYKNMVIIRHGNYHSVYSNLEEVSIKKDEKVSINQKIGKIIRDENGNADLHFELWHDKTKLNPELWLRRK